MQLPLVYADFHNADGQGRLRLNAKGTIEDLARQKIQLRAGLVLTLYSDDVDDNGKSDELRVNAVVEFASEEKAWVASIDWNAIHHASDHRSYDADTSGRQVG